MLSKMKHGTKPGSRIAEVQNGSSLFTGDAGQGDIRRWIIENDWLEAIVALPPVESRTSWAGARRPPCWAEEPTPE
jgi:type I restriction-modification system DNA methylase subunit